MSMLTLFESGYTSKGRYNIGNVGKTASTSMLTLFESRYTLKGRYNIGNVGVTASMSMLTLFESRYTLKGRYNIGNVGIKKSNHAFGLIVIISTSSTISTQSNCVFRYRNSVYVYGRSGNFYISIIFFFVPTNLSKNPVSFLCGLLHAINKNQLNLNRIFNSLVSQL